MNEPAEVWKPVASTHGRYEISSKGRVRNARNLRVLRLSVAGNGYLGVTLKLEGRQGGSHRLRAHRCVAEVFVPGYFLGAVVNHKDGNKRNNDAANLEWCTPSANVKHAVDTGLFEPPVSCKNGMAKLNAEEVGAIRANERGMSSRQLAEIFGVHHTTISKVRRSASYVNAAANH
ncbi:NUMOD4 domain-containing protein [Delftia acidovorans]|uniref:NUMOD4 domain-containing protein n=1 Tax=Delftia acidovorans TaxID=80866 RepID=UPI002FDCA309